MKYKTLSNRGDKCVMDSFVTHPWIFRDASSGIDLLANNDRVYWPIEWTQERTNHHITITIPGKS